jgi:glycerate 2-kinase
MVNVSIEISSQTQALQTVAHTQEIIAAGINEVLPQEAIEKYMQLNQSILQIEQFAYNLNNYKNTVVIAVGKAAVGMAKAVENILGDRINLGICVTKYGHSLPLKYCSIIEAAHPVPDENSVLATKAILSITNNCDAQSLVLFLLSGGASSLMADVPNGCSLQEVQDLFKHLVLSEASINEINNVRKTISKIKGGKLAMNMPKATIHSLIVSDVPNNDLGTIGSGPTFIQPSNYLQAKEILEKYSLWQKTSTNIKNAIEQTKEVNEAKTITHNKHTIIAQNKFALKAAQIKATSIGYEVVLVNEILNDSLAKAIDKILYTIHNNLSNPNAVLLFGGEITVDVNGNNVGGRNQHLALCLLKEILQISTSSKITIAVSGTDGTDGNTNTNGALISNIWHYNTQEIEEAIATYSSYNFFKKHGGHIITGATQTNVMDMVLVIITN